MADRPKRKRKVFNKRMRRHLLFLVIAFTVCFGIIIGAVVYYNIFEGDEYTERVLAQKDYESIIVPFKRGDIYDCNGSVLATSNKVYNLIIEPKNIIEFSYTEKATRLALKEYFGITEEELNTYLSDTESMYKVIRKKLVYDDVKQYMADDRNDSDNLEYVVGIRLEEEYVRNYPNGDLACHVLGFVVSGSEGIGGVEGSYNSYLNGQNGRKYAYLGENYSLQRELEVPTNGYSLVTTIDSEVQRIVQEKTEAFQKEFNAKNISVLVMNPKNCDIIALYNVHQYDPNNAYSMESCRYQFEEEGLLSDAEYKDMCKKLTDEEKIQHLDQVWRNFVISDTFEPGSTYKTFTISGAIEDGAITGDEQYFCDGVQQVADWAIKCHKRSGHGWLTVPQALEQSCNDALMQIAAQEGATTFDKYQVLFGFGQRTGIDIIGEPSAEDLYNVVYHQENLNPVELATSSFGQGLNVTMMQLGTAFCSVINGGYYYQPHVVKKVIDEDGNLVENYDRILVRRTISEETSEKMKGILRDVVENGTGRRAIVEGYEVGGKTGTAEKLPRNQGKYILSFIGFSPVDDPQVMVYCAVDEPAVPNPDESGAGALLFNDIAEELLPYMNIYKTGDAEEVDATGTDETATSVFEGDAPAISSAGSTLEENQQPVEETSEESSEESNGETSDQGSGTENNGETGQENGDSIMDGLNESSEGE
ncbi:MAG: penicillin-binding protein 2 [Eubacterium sp.]|nr:penicillin-binding protein 2 [Eubacterium sp.]